MEHYYLHTKRFSNSIITTLLFGIRTPTYNIQHAKDLYDIMERWSEVMEPGNTPPVDIYPIFKYIPESIFGNWVTRVSNVGKDMEKLYANILQKYRSKSARKKSIHESFFYTLFKEPKQEFTPHQLAFVGGVQMEGGSDTSASILTAFVQAMVQWPEVQQIAQAEINALIGEDRSPTWSDFSQLPYINAIMKECHRWRPVTPLGFPHALSEDEMLDDYVLPKGSAIILNVWGIQNDETDVFLGIAKLLWAFKFEEVVEDGQSIKMNVDPETGYTRGFLHCALPFRCKITVRGEKRKDTILREFEHAQQIFREYY
ncbi:hypothetical protein H072_10139 [Dactylellina haptotyla CBS 200.50]|uniref:Cytochrome P450 n=1 Tax=Dactylellina haptotyla (strain CBS 200.50) TaxID=1284197 RepID=S8BB61_DACHA|nr:hypothetical protein H072_10139 [Dactylellina haptotyla CBS 200.50]